MRSHAALVTFLLIAEPQAFGADKNAGNKAQMSRIHAIEKGNGSGFSELSDFLKDPDRAVRAEAVKALVKLGTVKCLDPLITATRDADGEVRVRATDGLVNFYLPGYVADSSLSGYFTRGVSKVKAFFSARNDRVIDEDVTVREDVSKAIADEIGTGDDMEPRTNASLAAGVLRLKAAVPALVQGLRSKDNDMIFECLIALQKIQDPSAGKGVVFLLRDLDERTQITALETVGVLKTTEAAPDVRYAVDNARTLKIRRAALSSLALLSTSQDREVFRRYVVNGDPELRSAALEGLGRVREPEDTPTLQASYDETNADWRIHLAAAFALVAEGNVSTEQFSPLLYLEESLNTKGRASTAQAYLKELMRREDVRRSLIKTIGGASKEQKVALSWLFGTSQSEDVVPELTKLSSDDDPDVATAAKRAMHVLQANRNH